MKNGKYVVKPWEMMVEQYGEYYGSIELGNNRVFPREFYDDAMKNGGVIEIIGNTIDGDVSYNDEQLDKILLGPYFKWGEKIEVRDNTRHAWEIDKFRSYTYLLCDNRKVRCIGCVWNYFRKIKTPVIDITVTINGKEAKLSDISDETIQAIKKTEEEK